MPSVCVSLALLLFPRFFRRSLLCSAAIACARELCVLAPLMGLLATDSAVVCLLSAGQGAHLVRLEVDRGNSGCGQEGEEEEEEEEKEGGIPALWIEVRGSIRRLVQQ